MKNLKINHVAVWVSIVVAFAVGFLWYSVLFEDAWLEMVGLDLASVEANPPGAGIWFTNVFSSVVQMYVLAWILKEMNVESGMKGAIAGLLIGFAFNHLAGMTSGMFSQYPYGLAWITGGFSMATLTLGGFILGSWRKYED